MIQPHIYPFSLMFAYPPGWLGGQAATSRIMVWSKLWQCDHNVQSVKKYPLWKYKCFTNKLSSHRKRLLCCVLSCIIPRGKVNFDTQFSFQLCGWAAWVGPFVALRPVHVYVEEHLALWCWLLIAWFLIRNTLYALLLIFPDRLTVQRPSIGQIYKYKMWLVSSL